MRTSRGQALDLEMAMDEGKWMAFIYQLWGTLAFWDLIKVYRKHPLPGPFFALNALACRNALLMQIANTVKLCEEIAKNFEVGSEAEKTLGEIRDLYKKGDTDRSVLKFDNCGVKPFRDKVLAHPLNSIKTMLGKDKYEISLKWETIEETLEKIKQFADQVEAYNSRTGRLAISTYKEEVASLDPSFMDAILALEDAGKYEALQRAIMMKGGRATVHLDWQHRHHIVVED